MGVIKPTITLTANASSATTDAGPLSIALSLSSTDSLDVTEVQSKIVDVSGTHAILWDASDFAATAAAGTDGAFMYLRNITAVGSGTNIMIGVANENLSSDDETDRLMTLQPQEFAWMPWDCSQDIYQDANATAASGLEAWLFVRTGTA
jgi:hypothetical protein|tara:strand:+ start:67 stop:513 length:447 start_codon:yes stop_codon:yes gene_type:complete